MKRALLLFSVLLAASAAAVGAPASLTPGEMISELSVLRRTAPANADQLFLAERLEAGLRSYETLKDYRAIFYKTENADGRLGDTEEIYLKFEKPFKIYMGWRNTAKKGLQVLYERGKHDGKLAIHKPGLFLGLAPVIFLEQESPWVREGSAAYDIEDAGIGNFLHDFSKAVIRGIKENKISVGQKEGTVEVTFNGSEKNEDYFAYRIVVAFEPGGLPVEMELYDWRNELIGKYAYKDLKFDVGPGGDEFRREIDRSLYRVYGGS